MVSFSEQEQCFVGGGCGCRAGLSLPADEDTLTVSYFTLFSMVGVHLSVNDQKKDRGKTRRVQIYVLLTSPCQTAVSRFKFTR